MSFAQLDGESDVEVDGQEKEEDANELGRLVGPAPFSYLTLYCPTFNESSDPKRRTYQIIYLVQGTLRFPVIRRRTIQLKHDLFNKSSLQPTKAFMRFS